MRCLEFFAGIGGFPAAFPHIEIVQAIDIDRDACCVYQANHSHLFTVREIASLPDSWFQKNAVDSWWMSPPCTPFTRKGKQEDLTDLRCDAFKRLVEAACRFRPTRIAMENVVGFESSAAFHWLKERWSSAGYSIDWTLHCPTHLGWPNRRPRFYALASRKPGERLNSVELRTPPPPHPPRLRELLQEIENSSQFRDWDFDTLAVPAAILERYRQAMDIIDLGNGQECEASKLVTACFTSSYGKSVVRSGSYLKTERGVRRFAPHEIAALLGFSSNFVLPTQIPLHRQWHLLGNSLSLVSVRALFGNIFSA